MNHRPRGVVEIEHPGARVLARPESRPWVESALERHGSLHRAASRSPDHLRMEGRGTVYAILAPPDEIDAVLGSRDRRWAVRHYRRGGWMAPLLGDRYLRLGTPRPFREMRVSDEVRDRRIPTPRVLAAAVYPSGPFYRGDLVTDFVPDALELAEILFDPGRGGVSGSVDRRQALFEAGALIRKMAAAGVLHPDLNAKNVLLEWTGGAPRGHLLDLDRCRVADGPRPEAARAMHERLRRSMRKLEKKSGLGLASGDLKALARGVEGVQPA